MSAITESDHPKAFISYSRTPVQNRQKVLEFAKQLAFDGIHAVVDEWDLFEGQDKYQFMERMVNDPTIKRVLLICTKEYADKANGRKGGVGEESLIISPEIYTQVEQTKFIPIIFERDSNGKEHLPTFVSSRIYIDLSNMEIYSEQYDKLLRNLFDKPKTKRPPLGPMPESLKNEEPIFLPTAGKVLGIKNAFLESRANATVLTKDYLKVFYESIKLLEIPQNTLNDNNYIEIIENRISNSKELRDDFVNFLEVYITYSPSVDETLLHEHLEKMLEYLVNLECRNNPHRSFGYIMCDAVFFFFHEFILTLVAFLISKERFKELAYLLHSPFIIQSNYNGGFQEYSFEEFRHYVRTLNDHKKKKFGLNLDSVVADTFKKRVDSNVTWDGILEADRFLYCISYMFSRNVALWYPETQRYYFSKPLLPKTVSRKYFERVKVLFKVSSKDELVKFLNDKKVDLSSEKQIETIESILRVNQMCTLS